MTKHDIYDEHEGFRLWNYMEYETLASGQEVWRINIEVKRVDEVLIPVVAGDQTYPDHGLAQVAGRELGVKLAEAKR
ncbi:hypothetical protein [Pseudomonas sp. A-RE-19]|uniref:hypothetical protein n=1 Tax=Pseudomonas sp. A-RE-19 TaxID=2832401 RepID=UPI001CBB4931|nr:hypothetical protein [Pseudomonas sp. A-RE-19]